MGFIYLSPIGVTWLYFFDLLLTCSCCDQKINSTFEGAFRNGLPHGCGTFRWFDGEKSIREYKEGVMISERMPKKWAICVYLSYVVYVWLCGSELLVARYYFTNLVWHVANLFLDMFLVT